MFRVLQKFWDHRYSAVAEPLYQGLTWAVDSPTVKRQKRYRTGESLCTGALEAGNTGVAVVPRRK